MDYGRFVKKLQLPAGFTAAAELTLRGRRGERRSRAQTSGTTCAGINASIDLIHRTRGGGWPTEPVTEEYQLRRSRLARARVPRRRRRSPTPSTTTEPRYLGCCLPLSAGPPHAADRGAAAASTSTSAGGLHRPPTSTATTPGSTTRCGSGSRTSSRSDGRTTRTPRSRANRGLPLTDSLSMRAVGDDSADQQPLGRRRLRVRQPRHPEAVERGRAARR